MVREEGGRYRGSLDENKKVVAQRIESVVIRYQAIVDWQNRDDVLRAMRRDIKRELRSTGDLTEDELDEKTRRIVEVARRRSTR